MRYKHQRIDLVPILIMNVKWKLHCLRTFGIFCTFLFIELTYRSPSMNLCMRWRSHFRKNEQIYNFLPWRLTLIKHLTLYGCMHAKCLNYNHGALLCIYHQGYKPYMCMQSDKCGRCIKHEIDSRINYSSYF